MEWNAREHDPEYPFDLVAPRFTLDPQTALVVIDMQGDYLQVKKNSPLGRKYPRLARYFNQRVKEVVMPNTVRLLKAFRKKKFRIAYTRNGSMTSTGDELTERLKALNSPPKVWRGGKPYDLAREIYPRSEELVIDKLTSGAFTSTQLDHALRNWKVRNVVVTGLFTDMCVLGSARTAAELGYNTVICE